MAGIPTFSLAFSGRHPASPAGCIAEISWGRRYFLGLVHLSDSRYSLEGRFITCLSPHSRVRSKRANCTNFGTKLSSNINVSSPTSIPAKPNTQLAEAREQVAKTNNLNGWL